jgi:hypothetical protein
VRGSSHQLGVDTIVEGAGRVLISAAFSILAVVSAATFAVRLQDAPARAPGHPERWTPLLPPPDGAGIDAGSPAVIFSEGIAVGCRWYDQQNLQPLFPFGHGLSSLRFE